jgi:hypothetical protein
MKKNRLLLAITGSCVLLFGTLCLNYTKMGSTERHTQFAQQRGWPAPSRSIVYMGMLLSPLGAGLLGFALGRKPPVVLGSDS